jgi:hypothetical protein
MSWYIIIKRTNLVHSFCLSINYVAFFPISVWPMSLRKHMLCEIFCKQIDNLFIYSHYLIYSFCFSHTHFRTKRWYLTSPLQRLKLAYFCCILAKEIISVFILILKLVSLFLCSDNVLEFFQILLEVVYYFLLRSFGDF